MKPKPPPVIVPKIASAYQVVSDDTETEFRARVEELIIRKFGPLGGIEVTAAGQTKTYTQAFIREGMHKFL